MAERLYMPCYLGQILKRFDFSFSKALGQNFLIDGNVVRSIVAGAGVEKEDLVIEIGPGVGTLTEELSRRAKKVISIEIDKRLIPILEYTMMANDNVEIINADAMEVDFAELLSQNPGYSSVKLVANLPYNVGTAIVASILETNVEFDSMTVMLQKEVSDRMVAEPGNKQYGALSVLVGYKANASAVLRVPKTVFIPKPKIDSMVVRLDLKHGKVEAHEALMFKLVRSGFNQRRKTIMNSLTSGDVEISKDELREVLGKLSIPENARAENLSIDDFASIAKELNG